MSYEKPYEGVRVIDLTHAVAGPYCASMLARLGADVIKIEQLDGDLGRNIGKAYQNDHTPLSLVANLGKRSICLDLKTEAGVQVLRDLLATADVFIESFRPGVTERLGFAYEAVKKINPRIIYLSVSGFGQRGPFAERPATDSVMQAFSGFMKSNKGFDGLPHRANLILMDLSAALYNLQAVQAALWARQHEAEGRYIDNSLLETAAALQNINLVTHVTEGESNQALAYPMGSFKTKDGHVMVGVLFEREFKPFMEALGLGGLAEDARLQTAKERYENRTLIDGPIEEAVGKLDSETFCEKLRGLRMLHERVNSYADFLGHEQTEQMGTFYWQEYPGMGKVPIANLPGMEKLGADPATLHAPRLGEHTEKVLKELDYSAEEVAALEAAGAIRALHS